MVPKPKVIRMAKGSMTKPSFYRAKTETKWPKSHPVSDVLSHLGHLVWTHFALRDSKMK